MTEKKPIILNLEQGTKEWLDARKGKPTASDSSAMMGVSPHKSRNELLNEWAFGLTEDQSKFKKSLFKRGHKTEQASISVINDLLCEDFKPAVMSRVIDGIDFMASLDGLNSMGDTVYEHKLYSKKLAPMVKSEKLDMHYVYQLEHQLMVSLADQTVFGISDEKHPVEYMTYKPNKKIQEDLVIGWKAFINDVEKLKKEGKPKIKEIVEVVTADIPKINASFSGGAVSSNFETIKDFFKELQEEQAGIAIESVQNYAEKQELQKKVTKARKSLKEKVSMVKENFKGLDQLEEVAATTDKIMQTLESMLKKQIEAFKSEKKVDLSSAYKQSLLDYVKDIFTGDSSEAYLYIKLDDDFMALTKGKSSFESMESSMKEHLEKQKVIVQDFFEDAIENFALIKRVEDSGKMHLLMREMDLNILRKKVVFEAEVKEIVDLEVEEQAQENKQDYTPKCDSGHEVLHTGTYTAPSEEEPYFVGFYLDREQYEFIDKKAEEEGISIADLMVKQVEFLMELKAVVEDKSQSLRDEVKQ